MPDTPIVFVPPTRRESELDDAFNEYLLSLDEWEMPHNLDDARAAWERRQA